MSENQSAPTFEEVDKHVESVDLSAFHPGGKFYVAAATPSTAAALPNFCGAYKAVRPILVILSNTPIIPAKWRAVIKAFIGVMDALCP